MGATAREGNRRAAVIGMTLKTPNSSSAPDPLRRRELLQLRDGEERASGLERVEAVANGVQGLTWQDVRFLVTRERDHYGFFWPDGLVRTAAELLTINHGPNSRALDLSAMVGSLIGGLSEAGVAGDLVGLTRHGESAARLGSASLSSKPRAAVVEAGAGSALITGTWDAVFAPAVFVRELHRRGESGSESDSPDQPGPLTVPALLGAVEHLLKPTGLLFLLAPPSFLRVPSGRLVVAEQRLRAGLEELGLGIDAVIATPPGAVLGTSIPFHLVVMRRGAPDRLFAAHLDAGQDPAPLLQNLLKRQEGALADLGRLVPSTEFEGWAAFVARREAEQALELSEMPVRRLGDFLEHVRAGHRERGFPDEQRTVYLPAFGSGTASTTFEGTGLKREDSCYQLVLTAASGLLPEYLAGLLNTSLGLTLRRAATRGAAIQRIPRREVQELRLPLPPLPLQEQVMEASRSIDALEAECARSRAQVWSSPRQAAEVAERLARPASQPEQSSFGSWVEFLPFPLASVLWRHHADAAPHRKVEHLLQAFEGMAQLQALMFLSWVRRDAELWEEARARCLVRRDGFSGWGRASFGAWLSLSGCLAKRIRGLLGDKDSAPRLAQLLGTNDSSLLVALCNKKLMALLQEAKGRRDEWKGHGGAVGAHELRRRVAVLQSLLDRLSGLLPRGFEGWSLLRAGSISYKGGVFHTMCESLMGTRSTFLQREVESAIPMEEGDLFLLASGSTQPVPLVPLLRFMPAPQSEATACYFYNRLEGEKVRWVSYHFEQEADVRVVDEAAAAFIRVMDGAADA